IWREARTRANRAGLKTRPTGVPRSAGEAFEETLPVPLRFGRPIGHGGDRFDIQLPEVLGRLPIDRLRQIVAGRVIPLRTPLFDDLVLRRILREADLERERRHAGL